MSRRRDLFILKYIFICVLSLTHKQSGISIAFAKTYMAAWHYDESITSVLKHELCQYDAISYDALSGSNGMTHAQYTKSLCSS